MTNPLSNGEPLYQTGFNGTYKLGQGFRPSKESENDYFIAETSPFESHFQLFKETIEELLQRPEFKESPKTFVAKWIKEEACKIAYVIPDSLVISYFKRKFLNDPTERQDIHSFGGRAYPWEIDGMPQAIDKEKVSKTVIKTPIQPSTTLFFG